MQQEAIVGAITRDLPGAAECRCGARLTVRIHGRSAWLECPRVLDQRRRRSSPLMPALRELLHTRRRIVVPPGGFVVPS